MTYPITLPLTLSLACKDWFIFEIFYKLCYPQTLFGDTEVQDQQLCFFCPISTSNCAYQLCLVATYPPHDATTSSTVELHKIADKFTCKTIPQFHCTIIWAGNHKLLVELQTCHCTLMLVWTSEGLQALSCCNVPNLNSWISISWDQYIIP